MTPDANRTPLPAPEHENTAVPPTSDKDEATSVADGEATPTERETPEQPQEPLQEVAQEQAVPQQEPPRTQPRRWLRWVLGLVCVILLGCGGAAWLVYDFLHSPGTDPAVAPAHDVDVTVMPGTTFNTLLEELTRNGAIRNADAFRLLIRWMDAHEQSTKLKPGRFRVNTGWTPQQVIEQLVNGSPVLDRVTIPEGLPWWEVGKRLEDAGMVRFEDFQKVIHDPAFLRYWGIPFDSAEGFLFPDTYLLMRPLELNEKTAKSVVGRLIDTFWRRTASLWPDGRRPGPSQKELVRRTVTLASIVEKETAIPAERTRVSGVYANRLRSNMLLQADPTTAYGLGATFDGRLRRKHLDDVDNPYNTYKNPGLPPGPICSPGLACLRAAGNPEQHDFIYFVAKEDGGAHVFSKTLAEHNRAVQDYLNSRKK